MPVHCAAEKDQIEQKRTSAHKGGLQQLRSQSTSQSDGTAAQPQLADRACHTVRMLHEHELQQSQLCKRMDKVCHCNASHQAICCIMRFDTVAVQRQLNTTLQNARRNAMHNWVSNKVHASPKHANRLNAPDARHIGLPFAPYPAVTLQRCNVSLPPRKQLQTLQQWLSKQRQQQMHGHPPDGCCEAGLQAAS